MDKIISEGMDKLFSLMEELTKNMSKEDMEKVGKALKVNKVINVHDIQEIPPENIIRNMDKMKLSDTQMEAVELLERVKDDPRTLIFLMMSCAQILGDFDENLVIGGKCSFGKYVVAMNEPAEYILEFLRNGNDDFDTEVVERENK